MLSQNKVLTLPSKWPLLQKEQHLNTVFNIAATQEKAKHHQLPHTALSAPWINPRELLPLLSLASLYFIYCSSPKGIHFLIDFSFLCRSALNSLYPNTQTQIWEVEVMAPSENTTFSTWLIDHACESTGQFFPPLQETGT